MSALCSKRFRYSKFYQVFVRVCIIILDNPLKIKYTGNKIRKGRKKILNSKTMLDDLDEEEIEEEESSDDEDSEDEEE